MRLGFIRININEWVVNQVSNHIENAINNI